jgi:type IV pilus assembly protein PilE
MKRTSAHGFSIIELLIVVAIVGIVASLAVPHLQKGIRAAENGNMIATLRTIAQTEVSFYSQNSRFGRLSEINTALSSSLGTMSGNELDRGKFALTMTPAAPTDVELKQAYTITATRNVSTEGVVYVYELTQTGEIRQILP